MTYRNLLTEMRVSLTEICTAARAGDADARRWLCAAFPGHSAFLSEFWEQRDAKRPDPAILRILRAGAANEASRKLIERIAGRGG